MRGERPAVAYWRLSGFYFFVFASLGALLPYWGLYLQWLGFDPAEIGTAMAVMMAVQIVAPNAWAWMADRSGHPLRVTRVSGAMATLAFAGLFLGVEWWWVVLVMGTHAVFASGVLPQFEAVTLNHLGQQTHRYPRIRVWGSVGFVVASVLVGERVEAAGPAMVPVIAISAMVAFVLCSFTVEAPATRPGPARIPALRQVLRTAPVLALLGAALLMQASHGPYYVFYSIYLQTNGYDTGIIGGLWSLGVLAEVVVFVLMPRLHRAWRPRRLLLGCFALATIRWLLIGAFPTHAPIIVLAQLLHAATFGVFHAVAVQYVHRYFTREHQARGQALYASVGFGAGGAVGSWASGHAWTALGPELTWLAAASVSGAGLVAVRLGLPAAGHEPAAQGRTPVDP